MIPVHLDSVTDLGALHSQRQLAAGACGQGRAAVSGLGDPRQQAGAWPAVVRLSVPMHKSRRWRGLGGRVRRRGAVRHCQRAFPKLLVQRCRRPPVWLLRHSAP